VTAQPRTSIFLHLFRPEIATSHATVQVKTSANEQKLHAVHLPTRQWPAAFCCPMQCQRKDARSQFISRGIRQMNLPAANNPERNSNKRPCRACNTRQWSEVCPDKQACQEACRLNQHRNSLREFAAAPSQHDR